MFLHQFSFARKPVPRANSQAVVAAVNAIADGRSKLNRDRTFQFNRQVGDAEPRVELERARDRARGAGVDATGARAAAIFLRQVRFHFQGRDDFGEEGPVAKLAADEVGVSADETESGALRQVAFEQRAGIHIPERARARAAESVHKAGQLPEAPAHDLVVIGVTGVAGDETVRGFGFRVSGFGAGQTRNSKLGTRNRVAGRQTKNASGAGQHLLRIDAFAGVALEVVHLPVPMRVQPMLELRRAGRRVSRCETAGVEAQLKGALPDCRFHWCDECPRASRNWWITWWTTSLTERISVFTNTSARR